MNICYLKTLVCKHNIVQTKSPLITRTWRNPIETDTAKSFMTEKIFDEKQNEARKCRTERLSFLGNCSRKIYILSLLINQSDFWNQ